MTAQVIFKNSLVSPVPHALKLGEKPRAQGRGKWVIYFITAGSAGPVKIGMTCGTSTESVQNRLQSLQTGNHEFLGVALIMPGDECTERNLHLLFRHSRIRGEWFERGGSVMPFVAGLSRDLRQHCEEETMAEGFPPGYYYAPYAGGNVHYTVTDDGKIKH